MEEKIKRYVEGVFADVPSNERTNNIKSEIIQNLIDKYRDLISSGKSEEDAYAIAISSGGDLSGIVSDLKGEQVNYNYNYEKQFCKVYEKQYKREKKKVANFNSLLWPITVCVYLLYSFFVSGAWFYSWNIFLLASAVSNLFGFVTIKSNKKAKRSYLSSFVWTTATFVYFLINFVFGQWTVSWIIFILAIPLNKIAMLLAFNDDLEDADEEEKENKK